MELRVGRVTPFARNPRAPAARTPQEDRQKFDPLPAPELPPVLGGRTNPRPAQGARRGRRVEGTAGNFADLLGCYHATGARTSERLDCRVTDVQFGLRRALSRGAAVVVGTAPPDVRHRERSHAAVEGVAGCDWFGFGSTWGTNRSYRTGTTKSVSTVELQSPQTITVASGSPAGSARGRAASSRTSPATRP